MHFDIITIIGILGGAFYIASQFQKDMISLRVLALASNVLYLIYSPLHTDSPTHAFDRHANFPCELDPIADQCQAAGRNHQDDQADRAGHRGVAGV